MSKMLTISIAVIVVIIGYLTIDHLKTDHTLIAEAVHPESSNNASLKAERKGNNFTPLSWQEFHSASGKFEVKLPVPPQISSDYLFDKKINEQLKYDTYVAHDKAGPIYMITAITFPYDIQNEKLEETMKQVIYDMIARNKNNKLEYLTVDKLDKGMKIHFALFNGEFAVVGKVLAKRDTVYMLTMVDSEKIFDRDELNYFVDSFVIKNAVTR